MSRYNKWIVSALGAAIIAILTVVLNSGAAQDWAVIITAVISSVGVWAVPNRTANGNNVLVGGK